MKSKNKLFIFTGVALAAVAMLLAITMSSGGNKSDAQEAPKDNGTVKIVEAAVDFDAHKVIQPADIVVVEVKTDEAPTNAITDPQLILNQGYQLGAKKGDVLLNAFIEAPGIRNSVDDGMRAVSLKVDTQGLFSGLVMDGDYVDVVFKTRVDLQKILDITGVEIQEDGPYKLKTDSKSNTNDSSNSDSNGDSSSSDSSNDNNGADDEGTINLTGVNGSVPYQGKPGGEFTALDGGGQLEPVAKILVQDVKVIRVIAPGVTYDGQGQQVKTSSDDNAPAGDPNGQLILQVTPAQAEAIAFMQDQNSSYQILVRGQDDHELATTNGVTYQILMTDEQWGLPWPKPVDVAPEETAPADSGS